MIDQPPFVSVVIPTYNHAVFLKRALQSVLDQSFVNWEVIVIDNHSSDNTDEVVSSFCDPRITLLKIKNNGVIAASRNLGIRTAKGKWIAFLDSDDVWHMNKLDKCLRKIDQGYDLVCHGEYWVSQSNGAEKRREIYYGPAARASLCSLLFEGNCISTSAVIVNRDCLNKVGLFDEDPNLITAEDYHLWVKLAQNNVRIGFVDELLGEYTIHETNSSKSALLHMEAVRAVFEKMYAEYPSSPYSILRAWRRRAIIDYSGARGLQETKKYREAIPYFIKAILRWPFIPKFYVALLLNILHRRVS